MKITDKEKVSKFDLIILGTVIIVLLLIIPIYRIPIGNNRVAYLHMADKLMNNQAFNILFSGKEMAVDQGALFP